MQFSLKQKLVLLWFIGFAYGCADVNCPSFPPGNRAWLPYSKGDKIELIKGCDTTGLIISDYQISGSYSLKENCNCNCEASLSFATNIDTSCLISLKASMLNSGDIESLVPPPLTVTINIFKSDTLQGILIPVREETFDCNADSDFTILDSALINHHIYYKVLFMKNADNPRFTGLKLSKDIGILEIIDSEPDVWK